MTVEAMRSFPATAQCRSPWSTKSFSGTGTKVKMPLRRTTMILSKLETSKSRSPEDTPVPR